jgi:signal transduction histidine kinase/ActR/RegA family two-component response regulator
MSIHLDRLLSQRYGFSVYFNRPVKHVMDQSPLVVEYDELLENVAKKAMNREIDRLYDHIVVTESGELFGLVSVRTVMETLIELHRQRLAERETLQSQLQQARKMEALGTLAGGISHDFNNILAAVIGYAELALDDAKRNGTRSDFIDQVIVAGNRAKELVRQILTFARRGDSEVKPIIMNFVINETIKLLRSSLPATIEIKQDLSSKATVLANPTQLHQITMNLCTNAWHAMKEDGGILSISLDDTTFGPDVTDLHSGISPGKFVKFSVCDTGHGIPAHIINRVFDPYFTTKGVGEGSGMGLSVVQGIVQSCHGFVQLESDEGEGTSVHVYLPVLEARPVEVASPVKEIPKGCEHILLVDDEPDVCDSIKQILQGLGYLVTAHTSSIEALRVFESDPLRFDLVITDMTMPHMTGDRLATELMHVRGDIPVILCTGYTEAIDRFSAKRLGVKAFALKPLTTSYLAELVYNALHGTSEARLAAGAGLGRAHG